MYSGDCSILYVLQQAKIEKYGDRSHHPSYPDRLHSLTTMCHSPVCPPPIHPLSLLSTSYWVVSNHWHVLNNYSCILLSIQKHSSRYTLKWFSSVLQIFLPISLSKEAQLYPKHLGSEGSLGNCLSPRILPSLSPSLFYMSLLLSTLNYWSHLLPATKLPKNHTIGFQCTPNSPINLRIFIIHLSSLCNTLMQRSCLPQIQWLWVLHTSPMPSRHWYHEILICHKYLTFKI